jgi:AraC-like DNA-binding protein
MAPPATILFSFRQIPAIVEMLVERGVDPVALLERHALPLDGAKGEITAPLARMQAFIDDVARRLDAPLFGLDLAERVQRGAYGLMEFVVRAAPTVRQGLEALCETSPLLNPLNEMRYLADERGCEIHFAYGGQRDALGAHLNEFTIAFVARAFASVLGKQLPLERAWFAHARKAHADALAHRLGCAVGFASVDCGFAVSRDALMFRPAGADAQLFEFLLAQARAQLANQGGPNVVAQVVRAIEARLAVSDVSANVIAESMGMTARSLQRHLADAGTTYRAVLARVRHRRRDELERGGLGEAEIARKLGFASARTMRRALDDGDA